MERLVKVYTWYNAPPEEHEQNDGKSITEQSFVPAHIQIAQMMRSGELLDQYRKGLYDFTEEEDDDMEWSDPTRSPNFDLADASAILTSLSERQKEAARASQKAKDEAEQHKLDLEAPGEKNVDVSPSGEGRGA